MPAFLCSLKNSIKPIFQQFWKLCSECIKFLWKTRTKNTHLQFIVDIGNDSYYPSFMENSIYSGNFHINIQGLILSFGKLAFYVWIGTSCLEHATFSLTASIHKMNILLFNTLNIDFIGLFELWFLGVQAIDLF